jgi:hypothetical protein
MAKSLIPHTGSKLLSKHELLHKMGKAAYYANPHAAYGISSTSKSAAAPWLAKAKQPGK